MFRTPKIWDKINCNLAIQVVKKPERSNQYTHRYNASKSRNAEGASRLILEMRMNSKLANCVSEKTRKRKPRIAFEYFSFPYKIWRRKITTEVCKTINAICKTAKQWTLNSGTTVLIFPDGTEVWRALLFFGIRTIIFNYFLIFFPEIFWSVSVSTQSNLNVNPITEKNQCDWVKVDTDEHNWRKTKKDPKMLIGANNHSVVFYQNAELRGKC